ncbi:SH3 domain-containing protein [Shouchella shacheensis]|uniref:SH3 domain-containing protein n=1 Tax=Shouchella shacheensis TaxID=1649580 RepID=UPI001FDFEF7D|nr:SH3 domain-containing protein [Shouchella shacheensis]
MALVAFAFPLQSAFASSTTTKETHYNISFQQALERQMNVSPQTDRNGRWQNASSSEVAAHLNPSNFSQGTPSYMQFLNLSSSAGLSASSINNQLLSGKGVLSNQGQAFINASRTHGINEIYLISHALLETGNGASQLARGVEQNGRTVYNVFGIGAFDGSAVRSGAQYAYNQGWFTVEDAIVGGAQFVSRSYIDRGQDTLYKMRWNPANPGSHQYATDIGWASKQTHTMSRLYSSVDDYSLNFDVPVYLNQPGGTAGEIEPMPSGSTGETTARLNLRTAPGTQASVITTLDSGQTLELLQKQGDWYQVKAGSHTGWVSGDYVNLEGTDNVEEETPSIGSGTTTARLNLRSEASTSSRILTTLDSGQKLTFIQKQGNWYQVKVGHQTGWVSADYVNADGSDDHVDEGSPSIGSGTTTARLNLRTEASTSSRILTTLNQGRTLELLQKQGNWYEVRTGSRTGWVSADYINEAGSGEEDTSSIGSATTTARLNLRSGAGTSHSIITTLDNGLELDLLQKQGSWYQVKAGSQTGWVSAEYLNVSGSDSSASEGSSSIGSATTTARLNLRSGAGTSNRILTTLNNGQNVALLQKQGSWYQVKAGSQTRWVSAEYLNVSRSGSDASEGSSSIGSATTTARLNLRSGAGTSNRILTTLNNGQNVALLQKQGNWYQVKAGSQTGWVSAENLNVSGSGSDASEGSSSIGSATTTARLNLRSGAGTSNRILTTLNNGQNVALLQKQGNWYQVKAGSQTGWVSAEYLNVSGSGSDASEGSSSIGSATTTARLNLRSGAGTSNRIVTTLNNGQNVDLLQKQGNWYQVKAGTQTGWVSAEYLNVSGSSRDASEGSSIGSATTTARLNLRSGAGTSNRIVTTLNNGQNVDLLQKQGNWYQVKAGDQTGWVSAEYLNVSGSSRDASEGSSIGSATTTARLNLRSGASTSNRIVTTLNNGQALTLLQKQGSWYQVKAGSQTGWVSAEYLNVSGSGSSASETTPSIGSATTTARLHLRSGAGTSHRILTTLNNGQNLELLQKQGNWYQVRAGNQTGWVSADYLNVAGSRQAAASRVATFSTFGAVVPEDTESTSLEEEASPKARENNQEAFNTSVNSQEEVVEESVTASEEQEAASRKEEEASNEEETTASESDLERKAALDADSSDEAEEVSPGSEEEDLDSVSQEQPASSDSEASNEEELSPSDSDVEETVKLDAHSPDEANEASLGSENESLDSLPQEEPASDESEASKDEEAPSPSDSDVEGDPEPDADSSEETEETAAEEIEAPTPEAEADSTPSEEAEEKETTEEESTVTEEEVELAFPDTGVTQSRVDLRSDASLSNNVLTTLNNRQTVEILDQQDGWVKVKVGKDEGWVQAKHIEMT